MEPTAPFWSIAAPNLAEHADNPVHTPAGGRAAGYRGAVVAGTTVYAYLTRWPASHWGVDWVTDGGAEVRFLDAVIADDRVDVVVSSRDSRPGTGDMIVEARVDGEVMAHATVWPAAPEGEPEPSTQPRTGERLDPLVEVLNERWAGYGERIGENLPLYRSEGLVHPVAWLLLANRVFATRLVRGPWVHTRSRVTHLGGATPGDTAVVEAFLVDRFTTRAGERAVVDVRIGVDDRPVAAVEHEAIVRLA